MGTNSNKKDMPDASEFVGHLWEESWTYIKTVVDIAREPFLILDEDFRVMAANEPFYRTFKVEAKDTEGKIVYQLGNGQWDIPLLRKLLEDILPKDTFFKGFEVTHIFPIIGKRMMILNGRKVHFKEYSASSKFPPIILLAMEDVTDMMAVADTLVVHTKNLETKLSERTLDLQKRVDTLEKEIDDLKKRGN